VKTQNEVEQALLKAKKEEVARLAKPLLDFYPFPTTRPGTEEALSQIKNAFDSGKKFVLVDAPTGAGKSGLAVAYARKHRSVILTPTKILQEQYANTEQFTNEYTIKGKSNYYCGLKGLTHTKVNEAVCVSDQVADLSRQLIPLKLPTGKGKIAKALKEKCVEGGICPYYTKIYNIDKVPGAVLNYDLFFRLKVYPGQKWGINMGSTLVLDEGHQLIDKVRDIFGLKFSNIAGKRLLGDDSGKRTQTGREGQTGLESPVEWLSRLQSLAQARMIKEEDPKKASKYDNFVKRAKAILDQDLEDEKKFYIEDRKDEFEIKPLDLRFLKGKIFYPFERVLLLSATFPSNFRDLVGIKAQESEVITIPSVFPRKNRPILFAKDLPKLNKDSVLTKDSVNIQLLDQILEAHKSHKGIIHTGNYKFMGQLKKIYQRNRRFIWVNQDSNKDEMMKKHARSKIGSILVSPSMMEGIDLKDDLARFGAILKVPFPMLDEYTRRMMKIFPSWYDNLTATNICQAYGREVRTEEDWAKFYILDGQFYRCLSKSKKCYSNYFSEALRVGSLGNLMAYLKTP
jgi:Rad3-related DNA helicase